MTDAAKGGRAPRRRLLRLYDPNQGLPVPPPAIGNIAATSLFAASALAVAFLGVRSAPRVGPGVIIVTVVAIAWPVFLAFGAWQVRPRARGEGTFRYAFAPVLFQALCFAVGGYFAVLTLSGGGPGGRMLEILVPGTVFATFGGITASFVLQSVARRAEALLLAQFTGPFLLVFCGGMMVLFA